MGSISTPISLQVIVAGGGISGLAVAIALRRAGHYVTIYENFASDAGAGAGIIVCANAAGVLKQWGLDLDSAGMLRYKAGYILDGKTLEAFDIIYDGSWVNKEIDNGEPHYMAIRQDLKMLLKKEAEREVLGEGTVQFRYGVEVVDYDAERPAANFADGTWAESDLVVGCDGIRSRAARVVFQGENPAKVTVISAFRMLMPDEQLKAIKKNLGRRIDQRQV